MFKSNFNLDTPEKIAAAIHNRTHILILQSGELLGFGGVIDTQTEDSVTINGDKYLKSVCEFRVR
jgi:hypothetical protein